MKSFRLMIAAAVGVVAGCASVPDPLEGEYSESFFPEQAGERSVGANVRWGGTVVETRPQADRTCIEILAQELDPSARPLSSDQGYGRFIACRNEFIDPEIFVNGREVTVAGELTRFSEGKIGEFAYLYPEVDANAVYLWPERDEQYLYARDFYNYGFPYYGRPFYYGRFHSRFHYPYRRGSYIHRSRSVQSSNDSNNTVEKK